MLTENRRNLILNEVNNRKSVTTQELMEIAGASESTIRRDITYLNKTGLLVKVFGGAVALDKSAFALELSVLDKESINKEEKIKIAKKAAAMIQPGDYIYIDSGTTTEYMIPFINEKQATYVTNAVTHARDLVRKGLKVLLIGGELKENTEAIVGADAILHIQKYHFSKGFFGTNGINMNQGFTTPDVREALVKRVAVEKTRLGQRYILADYDKFGESLAVKFADFAGSVVITNKNPGDLYKNVMEIIVA